MVKKFGDLTLREIANMVVTDCEPDCCPFAMKGMHNLCVNFQSCPVDMMKDMSDDFDMEVTINAT
jgi:hypothetical protein